MTNWGSHKQNVLHLVLLKRSWSARGNGKMKHHFWRSIIFKCRAAQLECCFSAWGISAAYKVFKGSSDLQISLLHPRLSHFHHCWHLGSQDGLKVSLHQSHPLSQHIMSLALKTHPLFISSSSHPLWFTNVMERSRVFFLEQSPI